MKFEWSNWKYKENMRKHGIAFDIAELVFNETMIIRVDDRDDYGEERLIGLSLVEGVLVNTVFVELEKDCYRIISMRKGDKNEQRYYFKVIR